jgi:exonuclease-1
LKSSNVKYVHAPYEADPQLTYLCNNGLVSAVLTEDSDMLVFGCATVLFKLDPYGGAIQIRHQDLFCNMNNGFDFTSWDTSKFRHMCMISGCDYLPSISGVGLKTAYNMLTKHKTIDKVSPLPIILLRMKMYLILFLFPSLMI